MLLLLKRCTTTQVGAFVAMTRAPPFASSTHINAHEGCTQLGLSHFNLNYRTLASPFGGGSNWFDGRLRVCVTDGLLFICGLVV